MSRFLALLVFALMLVSAAPMLAHEEGEGPISVEDAWSRATAASSTTGAVYLKIEMHKGDDVLIGAESPVADRAEIHQTQKDGDVMKMRPVDSIPLKQGSDVMFQPGGYHVMLVGLKQPLAEGGKFPLSLIFKKAGKIDTWVAIQKAGAQMPEMHHDHDGKDDHKKM